MIKSIGIFGDSFGTASTAVPQKFNEYGMKTHWSTYLRDYLNANVVNYAHSGSSVFYSYKKFIENKHHHDLIIFLISDPIRYLVPVDFSKLKNKCVPNLKHIEKYERWHPDMSNEDKKILNKISHWFEMSVLEHTMITTELMIEDVFKSPNVIVIPCFSHFLRNSFIEKYNLLGVCMSLLFECQMKELNILPDDLFVKWDENPGFISGHLTPEYNKIVFENIKHYLNTNCWDWSIPDKSIIDPVKKSKYFREIKETIQI